MTKLVKSKSFITTICLIGVISLLISLFFLHVYYTKHQTYTIKEMKVITQPDSDIRTLDHVELSTKAHESPSYMNNSQDHLDYILSNSYSWKTRLIFTDNYSQEGPRFKDTLANYMEHTNLSQPMNSLFVSKPEHQKVQLIIAHKSFNKQKKDIEKNFTNYPEPKHLTIGQRVVFNATTIQLKDSPIQTTEHQQPAKWVSSDESTIPVVIKVDYSWSNRAGKVTMQRNQTNKFNITQTLHKE